MLQYHRIVMGETPKITSYPTEETFNKAVDADKDGGFNIASEDNCAMLTIPQMVQCINYLRQGPAIKTLHDRKSGAKRLWALLTTRKDAVEDVAPVNDAPAADKALASSSDPGYQAPASNDAASKDANDDEDKTMAKAKKVKSKKAKAPKAPKTPRGNSVADRILKLAANGKTKAQLATEIGKAFPDREATAVDNTVRGVLSVLCRAKKVGKERVEGKGVVYTTL